MKMLVRSMVRLAAVLWLASLAAAMCAQSCPAGLYAAQEEISRFLSSREDSGQFHVQGWRWHTMSLVREADRLRRLAESSPEDLPALAQAVDYVVDFNMKGLHKIEKDLFFPWVRKKVQDSTCSAGGAFGILMDRLESERRAIQELGAAMNKEVSKPKGASDTALRVAANSAQIAERARNMLYLEDSFLVPTIARIVPEHEQKSFNNKVIRNLGVLDSRLHLVGMHEAVWELNDEQEKKLFEEAIPSIPQRLIPRWKRLLYQPRAGVLDGAAKRSRRK